jgi:hypothetical protein
MISLLLTPKLGGKRQQTANSKLVKDENRNVASVKWQLLESLVSVFVQSFTSDI